MLNNKTNYTILITQDDCHDDYQAILSGTRTPFFWKDIKKPKIVKIKCVEHPDADFDDLTHDWTCKQ